MSESCHLTSQRKTLTYSYSHLHSHLQQLTILGLSRKHGSRAKLPRLNDNRRRSDCRVIKWNAISACNVPNVVSCSSLTMDYGPTGLWDYDSDRLWDCNSDGPVIAHDMTMTPDHNPGRPFCLLIAAILHHFVEPARETQTSTSVTLRRCKICPECQATGPQFDLLEALQLSLAVQFATCLFGLHSTKTEMYWTVLYW